MTPEQQQVKSWMQKFGQECPEKPVIPSLDVRKLRAKLILEEALETINKGLGIHVKLFHPSLPTVHWLCEGDTGSQIEFVRGAEPNLKQIADGCSDLKVVTEGTLVACGLVDRTPAGCHTPEDPLFNEVMRSNNSKMWSDIEIRSQPLDFWKDHWYREVNENTFIVINNSGKVIKSPSYSPANLQPIIDEMSK